MPWKTCHSKFPWDTHWESWVTTDLESRRCSSALQGTITPTAGTVGVRGSLSALLELGAGFHPDLTGRENVYLNGSILGFSRSRVDAIFDDIVDFSEIPEFIDTQVKHYSSGMFARLGFAVAREP